jgi:hypothetical protein
MEAQASNNRTDSKVAREEMNDIETPLREFLDSTPKNNPCDPLNYYSSQVFVRRSCNGW